MNLYDIVTKKEKKQSPNGALPVAENAENLKMGDPVIITGDVQFKGSTGEIDSFGQENKFVVVNLYNHGKHSFHSSDVSFNDYTDDEDEEQDQGFFVVIASEDNGVFIGMVAMDGGKWREMAVSGAQPYAWGQQYMSYLTTQDVMNYIEKEYGRTEQVEGPFDSEEEARDYARNYFDFGATDDEDLDEEQSGPIEAYGYAYDKRDQRVMWRKVFKNEQELERWIDLKNATLMGTRPVEQPVNESDIEPGTIVTLTKVDGREYTGALSRMDDRVVVLKIDGTTGDAHGLGNQPASNVLVIKRDLIKSVEPKTMDEDVPPPENARKTQIAGTLPTYKKAADMLNKTGVQGKALDFGAGLGMGTGELGPDAHSYEPFPNEKFKPHFVDVTKIPSNTYHKIVNLNVLNVVPNAGDHRIRDSIVQNIGRVLAPGGVAIITTRGKDVLTIKGTPGEEPMSMISKIGTYQKGFTSAELKQYVQSVLGKGFEVSNVKLGPAGVMIKKLGQEQGVAEQQVNEYFVKAGMPVQEVLALNLFQDFDPVEGAAAQFEEFAQDPMWKQVVRKYAPIANMLKKKLLAQKRPLTDAEAEAVEQTWYDGSDAYDDMEIEYLIDIYDQQIDTLEALLAGNLTDEEFGEGMAEGAASHSELARLAHEAYIAAVRNGNAAMANHYKQAYEKHKRLAASERKSVAKGVAEGFSLGKVLRFPEFVQQLSATLKQQDPNWHMSKKDDNVFLFSIPNDHDFYSMLIVAVTQPGWIEAAHGTVDPEGQPNVYSDKQHLPMTAASVSEVAREAISNYHALDFSDYDDEGGVAEGSDDNEPFDYEEWKASTVKPRKPRGHKEAELMIQQQKEINRKRKEQEQEQGVAEVSNFKRNELRHELAHERNNIQVVINGKPWKVFPGRGYADSREEWQFLQSMKTWADKKSAQTGKKWSVHLTGASPTLEESDISGLLAAAHLNKAFIITAELAEGGTKRFRVKAQSARVAVEKFKKHASMAKVIDVKEVPFNEHIVKVSGGYKLKSKHGNKNLGKYPTKAGAEKRERQVQYFKHMGEDTNDQEQLSELSNELLGRYKKASGISARDLDKAGKYKQADKRFHGIVQATKKELDNDMKKYQKDEDIMQTAGTDSTSPIHEDVEDMLASMKRAGYDIK